MKKTAIFAIIIALFSVVSFAMTPTEIANLINKSKEANEMNGVFEPDKIYPGQILTFLFEDGTTATVTVEPGDSQWKIVEEKITGLSNQHGPVVDYTTPIDSVQSPFSPSVPESEPRGRFTWLWWLLLLPLAVWLLWKLLNYKPAKTGDPTQGGEPIVQGGVSDDRARDHMQTVVERQFGPGIQVREIVKGRLSGKNMAVFYRGELEPQKRTFTNVPAYRGVANINGTDQFVYFLQGCGNDAVAGNYFSGSATFIPDQAQPTVLNQVPEEVQDSKSNLKDSEGVETGKLDELFYKHIEKVTENLQTTGGRVDTVIDNCIYTIDIPKQKKE
jgi:plastocyanin